MLIPSKAQVICEGEKVVVFEDGECDYKPYGGF